MPDRAEAGAVRYRIPAALAELDRDRHQVIEASAGTGKTYLIEHRIVDLLLGAGATIEQILVVTFTEKATAELRARVRRLLERVRGAAADTAAEGEPCWVIDDRARHALGQALAAFDLAPIHTIHGFCHRVLTENAFDNRRLFRQSQVASDAVFADVFHDVLRDTLARDPGDRAYLEAWLDAGKSVEALESLLYQCSVKRGRLVPAFDEDALAAAMGAAAAAVDGAIAAAPGGVDPLASWLKREGELHLNTAKALARRMITLRALLAPDPAPLALLAALRADHPKLLATAADALAKAGDGASEPVRALVAAVAALERAAVPLAAAVAARFLPAVTARLRADKDRAGLFDFADMLELVWESLQGERGEALAARLRRRYPFALIDEFQDTDQVQWQIFRRLYLEGGGDARLCIIGDPKQAIYAFRGADVHTYLAARAEVRAVGGQVHALADNYRSTAAVVDAYNHILAPPDGEPFFSGAIDYPTPVRPAAGVVARDRAGADVVPVRIVQPTGTGLSSESLRSALLADLTAEMRRLLLDPDGGLYIGDPTAPRRVTAGDVFVLTRSTAEAEAVAQALRAAAVPCVLYKQEGLLATTEAKEIYDLLAAVAVPRDHSARSRAWLTRFFAVPLADLPRLADLPDGHPLVERLHEWKALADQRDYEALLSRIVADSGLIERELLLEPSERALTNFLHLFELLLEELGRSRCELGELVRRLGQWITADDPALDDRGIQRLESERDAVQIMTIHKSKGLEAAVVFLFGGFGRGGGDREVHVYHRGDERLICVGAPGGEAARRISEEAEAEDRRLLYVAMTRAVAQLHLPYVDPADCARSNTISGAYVQLNQRLAPVAAALASGAPSELARLFSLERLPVAGHGDDDDAADVLAGWCPPPALLADPAPDPAFAQDRQRRRGFVVTSYTRMKREEQRAAGEPPLGPPDLLELERERDAAGAGREAGEVADDELPRGAAVGIFLHALLEHVPLASVAAAEDYDAWRRRPEIERLVSETLARHDQPARRRAAAQRLVWRALTAPLPAAEGGVVDGLARCRARREVQFLYPSIAAAHRGDPRVAPPPAFVKGYIDVVFEHEGRVYVLDWKSDALPSYDAGALAAHVEERYRLQRQVYGVALARMLGLDGPGAHAARFGGLLYCFVRGLSSGDSPGAGVHFERPSLAELEAWAGALADRGDHA